MNKQLVVFVFSNAKKEVYDYLNGNTFQSRSIDAFRDTVQKKYNTEITYYTKPDGICFALDTGLIRLESKMLAAAWVEITEPKKVWIFNYLHIDEVDSNVQEEFMHPHETKEGARKELVETYNDIRKNITRGRGDIYGDENTDECIEIYLGSDRYELSILEEEIRE